MSEATNTLSATDRAGLADSEELEKTQAAPETQAAPQEGASETKPESAPDDREKAFADLQAQLEREKQRAAQAETLRHNAESEAARLRDAVQRGEISLRQANVIAVERAMEATDEQIKGLKAELTASFQTGDMARAADVQAAISEAAARKIQLEVGRNQLANMQDAPPPQQQTRDPYEEALRRYTPRTQSWLRQHPELVRDEAAGTRALMAHNALVAAGHVVESDAYFDAMDKALGYKAPDTAPAANGQAKRPAPALAPSRGGVVGSQAQIREVRDMTPKMLQLAKESDMKPEEWLRSYKELVAAGQIEPIH